MQTVASIGNLILENMDNINVGTVFYLKNNSKNDKLFIDYDEANIHSYDFVETYQRYFRRALELALPQVLISPRCLLDVGNNSLFWKGNIFVSYYGKSEFNSRSDKYILHLCDINKIKKWHDILIEYHKYYSENDGPKYFYWDIAYNEYINGLNCSYLEEAFIHLMTALEALTVKGDKNIGYNVSLNTSLLCTKDQEEQKDIFDLIKEIYTFRSKVIHGDDKAIKRLFNDSELYNKMFKIRKYVSQILFMAYGKDKAVFMKEINYHVEKSKIQD